MADTTAEKKKPFGFEVSYELFNTREERLRERLLIENPGAGQVLLLGIVNALVTENERISLNPRERADASSYHFRLRFAPNTLARRSVGVEGEDWISSRVDNADGSTEVYLSWRSPSVTLEPGEWLSLGLKGVSARPGVGAQVVMEFKWPRPTIQRSTAEALVIEPKGPGQGGEYELEAQRPLGTLNRQGRPDCPLRAGFVGDNQVLNVDNMQCVLHLRLLNEAPAGSQEGTLRFVYDANSPTRTSRLVVSLPVGTVADAPWALGTEQQVKDITFSTLTNWNRSAATLSADKTRVEWTFTPAKEVTLAPRAAWELQLSTLVTQHPDGPTELRVRYENVPGYWDGERVCVIDKAPLIFGQNRGTSVNHSGRVGVGQPNPTARLHVRGGHLRMQGGMEFQNEGPLVFRSDWDKTDDKSSVKFLKKDEATPLMELSREGQLEIRTSPKFGFLQTAKYKTDNNSTEVTVSVGSFADHQGGWLGTKTDHPLHFFTKNDQPAVTLRQDGTLEARKGRIKDKTGWLVPVGTIVAYGGSSAPEGWLLCDGSTRRKDIQDKYKELYDVIQDTYKGSSSPPSGHFRLPDLRARVPMGAENNYPLGSMGGEFTHTLTIAEMPVHNHFVQDPGHSHVVGATDAPSNPRDELVADTCYTKTSSKFHLSSSHVSSNVTLDGSGGDRPHNNVQPYTAVNFIIKY